MWPPNTKAQGKRMGRTTPSPKLMSTATVAAILAILASTCMARNVLTTGETLHAGEHLDIGQYTLSMRYDCNLVLYENSNPLWASNTQYEENVVCQVVLRKDGILVVSYVGSEADYPVWWSSNDRLDSGNYALVLHEDGNLVIYGTDIWSTGTAKISAGGPVDGGSAIGPATGNQNVTAIPNTWRSVLKSGEQLSSEQFLNTQQFKLIAQEDCNLVLYEYNIVIWASNTVVGAHAGCRAAMQVDGNFVIYFNLHAIWSSHTDRENGNYVLVLQQDGNVVIYGPDVWSTGTHVKSGGGRAVVTAMNGTVGGRGSVNQKHVTAIRKVGTSALLEF